MPGGGDENGAGSGDRRAMCSRGSTRVWTTSALGASGWPAGPCGAHARVNACEARIIRCGCLAGPSMSIGMYVISTWRSVRDFITGERTSKPSPSACCPGCSGCVRCACACRTAQRAASATATQPPPRHHAQELDLGCTSLHASLEIAKSHTHTQWRRMLALSPTRTSVSTGKLEARRRDAPVPTAPRRPRQAQRATPQRACGATAGGRLKSTPPVRCPAKPAAAGSRAGRASAERCSGSVEPARRHPGVRQAVVRRLSTEGPAALALTRLREKLRASTRRWLSSWKLYLGSTLLRRWPPGLLAWECGLAKDISPMPSPSGGGGSLESAASHAPCSAATLAMMEPWGETPLKTSLEGAGSGGCRFVCFESRRAPHRLGPPRRLLAPLSRLV
jgi:hypothetical protein